VMLIHNVRLVTWGLTNEILDGGAVLVEKGRIAEIGPEARMLKRHARVERLDGRGQLLMAGDICAHTHFHRALSRGPRIRRQGGRPRKGRRAIRSARQPDAVGPDAVRLPGGGAGGDRLPYSRGRA